MIDKNLTNHTYLGQQDCKVLGAIALSEISHILKHTCEVLLHLSVGTMYTQGLAVVYDIVQCKVYVVPDLGHT